jgi:murein L,D-transpeptidase YafK
MKFKLFLILPFLAFILVSGDFKKDQKRYSRVRDAYSSKDSIVNTYYSKKNIERESSEILIVAYKEEMKLQVWAKNNSETYLKIKEYDFCELSGNLGPKRKQGDMQVPEGIYYINRFNPSSSFHLSLGINYPNSSDRKLSAFSDLGGDIFIHGSCVTIGCIPITDELIKELYIMCVDSKDFSEIKIPVYIFPFEMKKNNMDKHLSELAKGSDLIPFWKNLQLGYQKWELNNKKLPYILSENGRYKFD